MQSRLNFHNQDKHKCQACKNKIDGTFSTKKSENCLGDKKDIHLFC